MGQRLLHCFAEKLIFSAKFRCRQPIIKERSMNEQPQDTPLLATLSPQERTRALGMLQPYIEHDVPLTHVARHHGIPLQTAQRWLAQYRRSGFAGLARRQRRDRGHPHGLPPELTQMIEGLALRKPPPTVALVHRQVCDVARRN
jgi:putative transposase